MHFSYATRWMGIAICMVAASVSCSADGDTPLHIKIPKELDHSKAVVRVHQTGVASNLQPPPLLGQKDPKDPNWNEGGWFAYRINPNSASVKVLVYYPGYKIITLEYYRENMQEEMIFEPEFVKLPLVAVTIKVVDSSGKGMAGHKISIKQNPTYFNFFDKRGLELSEAAVTECETDKDGLAHAQLPDLFDDPLITKYTRGRVSYRIAPVNWPRDEFGFTLDEPRFEARKNYPEPLVFKKRYWGSLQVVMEDSFLERNGLIRTSTGFEDKATGAKRIVEFWAHQKSIGHGQVMPHSHNLIRLNLESGGHILSMQILDENKKSLQKIVLEQDYKIGEKEKREFSVK